MLSWKEILFSQLAVPAVDPCINAQRKFGSQNNALRLKSSTKKLVRMDLVIEAGFLRRARIDQCRRYWALYPPKNVPRLRFSEIMCPRNPLSLLTRVTLSFNILFCFNLAILLVQPRRKFITFLNLLCPVPFESKGKSRLWPVNYDRIHAKFGTKLFKYSPWESSLL